MKLALILANRFEEVEGVVLIDLLRRAGIQVDTYGVGAKNISGGQRIKIEADFIFTKFSDLQVDDYDGLVLPGGPGTGELAENTEVLKLIKDFAAKNKIIYAICAAPLLLDRAGVLNDRKFTCYPGVEAEIRSGRKQNQPTVRDGNYFTAEGIGSAIEGALVLISSLLSMQAAQNLAKKIVYHQKFPS